MAQILDILSKEQGRDDENRRAIHLYQEGSFYRAYEWSAWLCHRHIKDFKVTHKKVKNVDNSFVFVGFPLTSLSKYLTDEVALLSSEGKEVEILLSDNLIPNDMSMEMMLQDFSVWKDSIPLTENMTKKKDNDIGIKEERKAEHLNLTSIMHEILAFPIENKSPMQSMIFLADIKQQLASLI